MTGYHLLPNEESNLAIKKVPSHPFFPHKLLTVDNHNKEIYTGKLSLPHRGVPRELKAETGNRHHKFSRLNFAETQQG